MPCTDFSCSHRIHGLLLPFSLKLIPSKIETSCEMFPSFSSDEAAAKVPLATVYQKHRSLLTRKRRYRG